MTLNFPNAPINGQVFGGYQYNTARGVWARANFSALEASTTNPGIVQLATANETLTGTAPSRAVTPVGLEPLRSRLTATVADFTALAALSTANKLEGDLAFVVEGAVYMSWTGTIWRQVTTATFTTISARDAAYAKASAVFRVAGVEALVTGNGITFLRATTVWRIRGAFAESAGVVFLDTAGPFISVPLPAGLFTVPPIIVMQANVAAGGSQGATVRVTSVTTTSFLASGSFAANYFWRAVQMTPDSASG